MTCRKPTVNQKSLLPVSSAVVLVNMALVSRRLEDLKNGLGLDLVSKVLDLDIYKIVLGLVLASAGS